MVSDKEQDNNNLDEIETAEEEKIPISHENAEEALLSILIQDEESAVLIAQSGLRDEHFMKRKNKLLFPLILNVRLSRGTANFDLIADACEKETFFDGKTLLDVIGGMPEITRIIAATPRVIDLKVTQAYIDLVFEQYRLSKVKDIARKLSAQKKFDEETIIKDISNLNQVILDTSATNYGLVPVESLVIKAYDRFVDRHDNPENYVGIKTGFYWLDKYRAVAKKRTTVVGAKTNVGKSILASNMISTMIHNDTKVLLFTPELDKDEYMDRLLCAEAEVPIDIWKAATCNEAEMLRMDKANKKILSAAGNLYIEDRGSQSCGFIINSIKKHMLNHRVDVVVIDYLGKLHYTGDIRRAFTENMDKLCAFAKDNNIAMIVISQLRRSQELEPQLYDLKECVVGSTELVKSDGSLCRIDKITPGDRIMASDRLQKINSFTVNDVWCTGKKKVYTVKTETGRKVTVSANHPFMTPTKWERIEYLKVGDTIGTARAIPLEDTTRIGGVGFLTEDGTCQLEYLDLGNNTKNTTNNKLCRLMGYFVGDGTYLRNCGVGFINSDRDVARDVIDLVYSEFGLKPTINPSKTKTTDMTFSSTTNGHGKPFGNPLRNWIRSIGVFGQSCYNKTVPEFVFKSGDKGIINFLEGYLATDGAVYKKGGHWNIKFTSVSPKLCQDVQFLLLRLGIVSRIDNGYQSKKATTPLYNVCVARGDILNLAKILTNVTGKKGGLLNNIVRDNQDTNDHGGFLKLPQEVGEYVSQISGDIISKSIRHGWKTGSRLISVATVKSLSGKLNDPILTIFANSDILWEKIVSIEPAGEENTYDVSVEGAHNFLGNGIFLHNSGDIENFADCVVLLHRNTAGSAKDRLTGWYMIAKNRQGPRTDRVALAFRDEYLKFVEVDKPITNGTLTVTEKSEEDDEDSGGFEPSGIQEGA